MIIIWIVFKRYNQLHTICILQSNECNKIDLLLSPIVNDLREGVATNNVLMWIDSLFKKLNRYRLNNQTPLKNEFVLYTTRALCTCIVILIFRIVVLINN